MNQLKHLRSTDDLGRTNLEALFRLATAIKKNPKKFAHKLSGKVIATLFFEPSTRTRCSFESAILRLGAGIVSTENAREHASATKGESLEDTIKMMSCYSDAIIMRHFENDSADRASAVATVPFINAGSGSAGHPTQSILDAYTILEQKGRLDNLKIAVVGDLKYGRTANSLIKLLSLYGGTKIYALAPKGLELDSKFGAKYCTSFDDIPTDVDVIYQTRIQKERLPAGVKACAFTITKAILDKFSPTTLLMHPLPRVDEIEIDCDTDPRAMYFIQAQNGIPTRMALLLMLMGHTK
jgi:aspartate carbamoyltransferase catalytic subunit